MNHLTLRGTHREMGFQWGARLAERGLRPDPAALPAGGGQPRADGLPGDSLPSGAGGQPPLTPAARLHTIERNLTKRRG